MLSADYYQICLLANLVATSMMTGVIWLVQLVHYPLFEGLDPAGLKRWHEFHSSRITLVVAPLMVAELALCLPLAREWQRHGFSVGLLLAILTTIGIWASTFLVSVPLHTRLGAGEDPGPIIRQLVRTNWPRTILYSVKLGVLLSYRFGISRK